MNKDPQLIANVEKALDQLRPYLITDGGNMELVEITEDMVVRLRFLGACKECRMSMMTLKAGIEQSLLRSIPEITAVEAINISPN